MFEHRRHTMMAFIKGPPGIHVVIDNRCNNKSDEVSRKQAMAPKYGIASQPNVDDNINYTIDGSNQGKFSELMG